MKRITIIFSCLICLLLTSAAFAEYYRYVDENGVKHFTENYSDIPERFKPETIVHKSITPEPAKKEKEATTAVEKTKTDAEDTSDPDMLLEESKKLILEKQELETEYGVISEKSHALSLQKETLGLKEYNKRATQLNEEILAYQKKRKDYEMRVENYNQRVNQPAKE